MCLTQRISICINKDAVVIKWVITQIYAVRNSICIIDTWAYTIVDSGDNRWQREHCLSWTAWVFAIVDGVSLDSVSRGNRERVIIVLFYQREIVKFNISSLTIVLVLRKAKLSFELDRSLSKSIILRNNYFFCQVQKWLKHLLRILLLH